MTEDGPVARVLKVHHWATKDAFDSASFVWKCGMFGAKKSDSGAFIPNMSDTRSVHSIKVTRQEMAEMAVLLGLNLNNHVSHFDEDVWLRQITGKDR